MGGEGMRGRREDPECRPLLTVATGSAQGPLEVSRVAGMAELVSTCH